MCYFFFFFSSRRRHTRCSRDWSSDVCSSDLLPETAVDDDTLDVLAAAGIRFTILAPHQVQRAPEGGLPGWYRTSGGRRIAVFIYDGAISHDVAFGPLVRDAAAWVERLTATPNRLVAVATDGETDGHHHKEGDVVLARVLET